MSLQEPIEDFERDEEHSLRVEPEVEPDPDPAGELMLTNAEIARRFNYHKPTGDQPARYETIRGALRTLAYRINELCPPSRELSLAFTHLEQVGFYANAAIARRGE